MDEMNIKRDKERQRNLLFYIAGSIFLCFLFASAAIGRADNSPYFPKTGTRAVYQDLRDLKEPVVCLVIAMAPGFEDLPTVANLRIGNGVRVEVAYVTNGEDIPSDLNGETFYRIASRRKEEAYQAISYLGAQAYFLNIPINELSADTGCFHPTPWLRKVLGHRLDSLISQVKPDIIMLCNDPLSEGLEKSRFAFLEKFIMDDFFEAGKSSHWGTKRFFIQTNEERGSIRVPVERNDPIWLKSYLQMGREAEKFYQSLRFQIRLWDKKETRYYAQVYPKQGKFRHSAITLIEGLPEIGRKLRTLLPMVRSVESIERVHGLEDKLSLIRSVITEVDEFTSHYEHSLNQSDLRVLVEWKEGLEKLRCALLDVFIPYDVSDTVVTQVQLFFLKFGELPSTFRNGKTEVLFPGVIQKQWIVNEAQKEYYDWKDSAQFRVLSPRSIPLNSPEAPNGFEAMQVRTPFVFIVVHQDPNPDFDFQYREEIHLIIAPYRSIEVLTPQVAIGHDSSIVIRFTSNVRDRAGGVFYVKDSIVSSPERTIELPGKNVVVIDTLPLVWSVRPHELGKSMEIAPHEVKILGGPKGISPGRATPIGSFVARPLDVRTDIDGKVGVCSAIVDSPILIALRRLGIRTVDLSSHESSELDILSCSRVIVDQFSIEKFLSLLKGPKTLERWLMNGGRLIILPQFGAQVFTDKIADAYPFLLKGINFSYLPVTGCSTTLEFDRTSRISDTPNDIADNDFAAGQFVFSYGDVVVEHSGEYSGFQTKYIIRSSGRDFLVKREIGNGYILYCAVNLHPGLLSLDMSSYKLLANMVGD
jgi:hypothetical protein